VKEEVVSKLKERYSHLPELVFHRSVERARTEVELFDILDSIPDYPIAWDSKQRRWIKVSLLKESDEGV